MTVRNLLHLSLFALALTAAPITLNGTNTLVHVNLAFADDSEDFNAPREGNQKYGNFPNQGGANRGWPSQGGWNQNNRNNCGYANDCGRNAGNQEREQERKQSRFSRKNRDGFGGDGGDDD